MKHIHEKINQSVQVLKDLDIDMWLTFVRESESTPDPVSNLIVGSGACWLSAYIIEKDGCTTVLVGQADVPDFERSGLYQNVETYSDSVGAALLAIVERKDPRSIAINYSTSNYTADGLSHGLYLMLCETFNNTPYRDRLISAEEIIRIVRGQKTETEIERIQKAAELASNCWFDVLQIIKPGMSEKEIAAHIIETIRGYGCDYSFSPIVNAGTKTKPGHGSPTEAILEVGELLHVDFGVRYKGYCSDIQRVAYVKSGNEDIPGELTDAFNIVCTLLHKAIAMYKPGAKGHEIDGFVRKHLTAAGYPEYGHGLGHQIGQAVHDGGAFVGPLWPRYGQLGAIPLMAGNTFTAEFGVTVDRIGHVSLEEDLVVTPDGGRLLCQAQTELAIIE